MIDPARPTPPSDLDELFAAIHRDFLALLVKTTNSFAIDRADRADLFQEILIALWEAIPRFDARAKLSTYVYRVALSCALNWKRSRSRYARTLDRFTQVLPVLTSTSNPDQERLNWLYARIHELPPVDRTLILLSLDRLNYTDIAEITGLSESNVGVRLHRIKQQLAAQSEKLKNEL